MIKNGILNYLKNLKHFFTPLGTIFLGILFGLSFLFSGFNSQVNEATNQIQIITQETNISINDLKDCVIESFANVPWEEPVEAIKLITSSEWLNGTLKVNISNTIENYQLYAKDIEDVIVNAVSGYVKYIIAFFICIGLGFIGGFFLTKYLIRRKIAKRNFWKFLLITLIDCLLVTGLVSLCLWFISLWKPSIIISSLLSIIIFGFISLFEAYLIHGYKNIPFRNVVNVKNVFLLYISNILIYLIALAISSIAILITNQLIGTFIALSLLIIGVIVISLNAEAYIKKEVDKLNLKKE